jgi:hypothetical protein
VEGDEYRPVGALRSEGMVFRWPYGHGYREWWVSEPQSAAVF